jgi:hypothetical protein
MHFKISTQNVKPNHGQHFSNQGQNTNAPTNTSGNAQLMHHKSPFW